MRWKRLCGFPRVGNGQSRPIATDPSRRSRRATTGHLGKFVDKKCDVHDMASDALLVGWTALKAVSHRLSFELASLEA